MKTQVMLDLETLGNKPGSVIVAIGAVKFGAGQIIDTFYERVDAQSCVSVGLTMDVSTILWWMAQDDAARKELTQPGKPLSDVLIAFSVWLDDADAEIWGNGANFDNVLLRDAYDRTHTPCPWKWYNDRCFRTVRKLRPDLGVERSGTYHNALDDARTQAIHLMKVMDAINPPRISQAAAPVQPDVVLSVQTAPPSVPCGPGTAVSTGQ
jgi:hypothetical protein